MTTFPAVIAPSWIRSAPNRDQGDDQCLREGANHRLIRGPGRIDLDQAVPEQVGGDAEVMGHIVLPSQRLDGQGPIERLVGDRGHFATGFLNLLPEPVGDPAAPDIDDDHDDEANQGAQAEPGIDSGDHDDRPHQEERDAGGVGQRPEDAGALVDIGVGNCQEVTNRLPVEPRHAQGELVLEELVSHVLSGPELEIPRRGAAHDDAESLDDRHREDGGGRREQQALGAGALVQNGDDHLIRHPSDYPRRGNDGAGEQGGAEYGEPEGRRMPLDEPPDEADSVAQQRPGGDLCRMTWISETYNFKFGLSQVG